GALTYGDPAHPHAVTSAGGDSFGYNAVGNQITRPGSTTIKYAPFDLPASVTQGADVTTFGYDGDQARIRKTTPTEETLYFGDLYERVTEMGSASTEHRYYVQSPERPVAVVTRGGKGPGTRYLHVDHLGSVDAVTDGAKVIERRSYDPFGSRRNPIWGQPPPASFTSKTTKGFTGHESDDELGLVNAKGRIYDPKLGRFLTTDPVISNLWYGQSLNAYSYVFNRPLSLVDPSGFDPAPDAGVVIQDGFQPAPLPYDLVTPGPLFQMARYLNGGWPPGPPSDGGASDAARVGAGLPANDVDTTGSSPVEVPQGVILVPDEGWMPSSPAPTPGDLLDDSMPSI